MPQGKKKLAQIISKSTSDAVLRKKQKHIHQSKKLDRIRGKTKNSAELTERRILIDMTSNLEQTAAKHIKNFNLKLEAFQTTAEIKEKKRKSMSSHSHNTHIAKKIAESINASDEIDPELGNALLESLIAESVNNVHNSEIDDIFGSPDDQDTREKS